ncbi:MAG: bacteriophage abortive infection AbiH family protein [Acholeplasma sp.]|nr:bacteriophage abortive infection AbiH family protein [Acholeplasma sp.]
MTNKINTLYIIGNGFDRYHNLETEYYHFARYFKRYYRRLFDKTFYYYPSLLDIKNIVWSDFENQLAEVDYDQLLEDNLAYINSPSNPEFRDSDWHNFAYEIGITIDELKASLVKLFKKWVDLISIEKGLKSKFKHLSENYYISFNYTKTLQTLYNVPPTSIWHIHGESKSNKPLVFGHNKEYWYEQNEDSDMAYIFGQQQIERFFSETKKNTDTIILTNTDEFEKLKDVNVVYVLGHSLNEIDLPYFEKIAKSISKNAIWNVSNKNDRDIYKHRKVCSALNIQYKPIKISEIFEL